MAELPPPPYVGQCNYSDFNGIDEYQTVFGGGKDGKFRISLEPKDVLGYLFWTKYAGPFHAELEALRVEGVPYVFQYTITGYGKDVQSGIPHRDAVIEDFMSVAESLPGATAIQWRYDPILISSEYPGEWHRKNFEVIADHLQGYTHVVNVSFIEPYLKALNKAADWRTIRWRRPDPVRHKSAFKKYPDIHAVGADEDVLVAELADIARKHGIELRVCCNEEYGDRFPAAVCCGVEMFLAYGEEVESRVSSLGSGPSRPGCRCLKTVDIGMDSKCPGGCFYCYVTTSLERARLNYEKHDPAATMLR